MKVHIGSVFLTGVIATGLYSICKLFEVRGYKRGYRDRFIEIDRLCMAIDPEEWQELCYNMNVHKMLTQANDIIG